MLFLRENNIISNEQDGFLSRRSPCTNLLEALDDWSLNLNDKTETDVAFFNFAKAFDKVSIPKIMFKLHVNRLGITGNLLACIRSFLTGRFQYAFSTPLAAISGVPQGNVTDLILFLLYIKDIINAFSSDAKAELFTDDLKSFVKVDNDVNICEFESMLVKISSWANAWQLPLSISKCCFMLISNKRLITPVSVALNGVDIERTNDIKELDILFNENFNFSNHISSIIKAR